MFLGRACVALAFAVLPFSAPALRAPLGVCKASPGFFRPRSRPRSCGSCLSVHRWSRRAKAGPSRRRRSSCAPGTGSASRIAGAARRGAGRRGSDPPWSGCSRFIWATIFMPANRPAKRSKPRAATSSSCASVGPQDIGRTPAGHGAARGPPDRGPGFGQTPPPVPVDDRPAPARRRRRAPRHPA